MEREHHEFRDYGNASDGVRALYKNQRTEQCLCFVHKTANTYLPGKGVAVSMSPWSALLALNELVDQSDPDATVPNMHHAFQTAEGLRKEGKPEWMQLVGLLHDLGKVLFLKGSDGHDGVSSATQYAVVGDTFIVGYPRSTLLVYPEYNNLSQCECENESPALLPKCGFDACTFSFGHDEYLYQVLMHNQQLGKIEVPSLFAYVVRYHSFHAWHQHEAYKELASPLDQQQVKWLREFVEYDLYTKSDADLKDANELKAYYETLMQKCLGCSLDDSWEF